MRNLKKAGVDMNDCYLNVRAAAEYLGVRPFTLRVWSNQKQINHYRAGRLLRFKKADLDSFMKKEFVPSGEVEL